MRPARSLAAPALVLAMLSGLAAPARAGGRDVPGGPRASSVPTTTTTVAAAAAAPAPETTPASEPAEETRPLTTVTDDPALAIPPPPPLPEDEGAWRAKEPEGRPKLETQSVPLVSEPPRPRIDSAGMIPLSLQQAIELALAHQLDIHGSRIDNASAEARVLTERGAFDPVLNGLYQHDQSVRENAFFFSVPLSTASQDTYRTSVAQKMFFGGTYDVGLVASRRESNDSKLSPQYDTDLSLKYTQPLLRGFGRDANRAALGQAINSRRIAELSVATRARDIVRDTIRAYWELIFARRDVEVRRLSLGLAQELLRKNRIMVEVGTLAPLEISQAEASVAEREFRIISAENAVGNAEDDLRRLLGVRQSSAWWNSSILPTDEPEFAAISADLEEELSTAALRREEIPAQQLAIESAKLGLAAAKDSLLPQLNFEISSGFAGLTGYNEDDPLVDENADGILDNDGVDKNVVDAFEETFTHDFESYTTALIYSQPLRNRAAEGSYLVQRLALESARLDLELLRQTITLEVRSAVRNLDSARESVVSAGATRQLQRKTLDSEIKKFENGLSTNFEVLQFQTDLQEAASAEIRALITYLQAQAELRRARGTLLEDYGLQPRP